MMGYLFIFGIGVVWYFFEIRLFSMYNHDFKEDTNPDTVYSSISYPRVDDLLFNFLGMIIHFLTKCYFKS
jgi:glycopeptide antibiotics resistance protein